MTASTKAPQLFHAPFTCSLAVRLAAAWGDVELDVLPVKLGRHKTEAEKQLRLANPTGQVSTLILPDESVLTETNTCLIWTQSQSKNDTFRRDPNSPDYYQMLRWISFCSTELHKQLLRIVFYDEATDTVKENFRTLAKTRLAVLDKHLTGQDVLVGDTLSAADAYLAWFLTLSDKAGVEITPYEHLQNYANRQIADANLQKLLTEDAALKETISI